MSGSMLDDDTRRAVNSGRQTVGAMLSAAQQELQKVFIVFVLGLVGTIFFLRRWGWEILKGVMEARMDALTAEQARIIVRTPFDVILLQIKLGLAVGILLAIPLLLYYGRGPLRRRGILPEGPDERWKTWLLGILGAALFAGGIAYAYYIFFPIAFNFLTVYTLQIGFNPSYDIVKWTHFIILLTFSFGLAAELPLAMSALSYGGIVPYEYFRDKWRYAIMGIFLFGALFSPPDPFTQLMWAAPLIVLYGFSLYLSKFFTAARRSGSAHIRAKLWANRRRIVGPFVAVTAVSFLIAASVDRINALLADQGVSYGLALEGLGLPFEGTALAAAVALLWGLALTLPLVVYYSMPELEPRERRPGPAGIDLRELDAEGVEAAPVEAFLELEEEEAVNLAGDALDEGDDAKAQAILDRFDDAKEAEQAAEEADLASDVAGESRDAGDVAKETTADVVDAFTEEETTEEDIGGYYYDFAFILDSLTSRSFRVAGIFMASMILTFFALYQGGFKLIRDDFFSRLPQQVLEEEVSIVALHPVEAILFEIKMSLIAAVLVTLPALLYYAWPAIERRFRGITHSYETPSPGAAVAARWNRVAAFFVLAAALVYTGATGGVEPLTALDPGESVTLFGYALTAQQALYVNAAGAGLLGAVPAAVYYAWPSLRERWMVESSRGAFLVWAVTLVGGVVVGSVLGYLYIAPGIISYLVVDAVDAGMRISYTINDFFWLVFATTAGIGLMADIPLSMWLFHRTGIVSYRTMRERWRGVIFVVFVAAAFFTNHSIITMVVFGIPISLMYGVGLAGLWVGTFPSRMRRTTEEPEAAD